MRLLPLALLCLGCSSQTWTIDDAKGRTCVRRVDNSVTCNVPPQPSAACFADLPNACFALVYNNTVVGVKEQLCDACCATGDAGPVYQLADCVDIECTTDTDCAVTGATCTNGICLRP